MYTTKNCLFGQAPKNKFLDLAPYSPLLKHFLAALLQILESEYSKIVRCQVRVISYQSDRGSHSREIRKVSK